jgi:hypothetical protein
MAIDFDGEALYVRLALSDGSVSAAFWPIDSLKHFMKVVTEPTRSPLGAMVN